MDQPLASTTQTLPKVGHRVLVVDDTPHILQILTQKLAALGYTVKTAANGYDVGFLAMEFKPELIFLDIMLPGMDGVEVCRRIRENPKTAGTKILAMSATSDPALIERMKQAGADDFMPKPFTLAEIPGRIEGLLGPIRVDSTKMERNRILLVGRAPDWAAAWADVLGRRGYRLERARSLEEAGFRTAEFKPDAVVIESGFGAPAVKALASRLGAGDRTRETVLVAVGPAANEPAAAPFKDAGAVAVVGSGETVDVLIDILHRTVGPTRRRAKRGTTARVSAPEPAAAHGGGGGGLWAAAVVLALGLGAWALVRTSGGGASSEAEAGAALVDGVWRDPEEMIWLEEANQQKANGTVFFEGNWYPRAALGEGQEVTLKDGRSLTGLLAIHEGTAVLRAGRGPDAETFPESGIAARVRRRVPYEDYWAFAATTADYDPDALHALAEKCRALGLEAASRWEDRRALLAHRDHPGARQALGYVRQDGTWVKAPKAK